MIRFLLFVALFAVSFCEVDQSEYFGPRLSQGPFCDSRCTPGGTWTIRRDWFEPSSEIEDKFLWAAGYDDWEQGEDCGEVVNNLSFEGEVSEFLGSDCHETENRPDWIYLLKQEISYSHSTGLMTIHTFIDGAFKPSEESWDDFVDDLQSVEHTTTSPWSFLRVAPSRLSSSLTDKFNDKWSSKQVFVSGYEANFCTFSGSMKPISYQVFCESKGDDGLTLEFCEHFLDGGASDSRNINECEAHDSDDCDFSICVSGELSCGEEERKRTPETKPTQKTRNQYGDLYEQAYPAQASGIEIGEIQVDPVYSFTYVPSTSSIVAPYCGYRN